MAKWDMERVELVPRGRPKPRPAAKMALPEPIIAELQEIKTRVEQLLTRGDERAHPLAAEDWHLLTNINARLTGIINDGGA